MAISKDGPLSSEREAQKQAFLAAAGLADAHREGLPVDASSRSYERLIRAGKASLMLMDSPPAAEGLTLGPDATEAMRIAAGYVAMARLSASRVDAFVAVAGYLRGQGLSAPEVVAFDATNGFAVLEDLGDGLFARMIEAGEDEGPLYDCAIETLARLQAERPPALLEADGASWPLLTYDDLALKTGGDLFLEWLPALHPSVRFSSDDTAEWDAFWAPLRARAAREASVFCHRDYHAENLLWLPERAAAARVGLLDFQDAVLAHPAWDLSMLLHDARRDISPELEAAGLAAYFARTGADREAMMRDYSVLGALNILRILGIFSRLITRDKKPRYGAFMGRMWGYLDRVLTHPELAPLERLLAARVPREVRR